MKVALIGYGTMGKLVKEELGMDCVVCIAPSSPDYMANLFEYDNKVDVIIDFSNPANLDMICEYASMNKTRVVIATTGYTLEQEEKIKKLAKEVAVLKSSNFSLGTILMNRILKEITPILADDFDIEFIETNQAKKIEDPSKATEMMLDTLKDGLADSKLIYGRNGRGRREHNEIGVHSIRGGNIIGEQEVMYCGENEIISIKHTSISKNQFAEGAVLAANWIKDKPAGLYTMEDVLFKK